MIGVKANFKHLYGDDLTFRTCQKDWSFENENHLLKCEKLKNEASDVVFEDCFKNLEHQIKAIKVFKVILRKRDLLLKYEE